MSLKKINKKVKFFPKKSENQCAGGFFSEIKNEKLKMVESHFITDVTHSLTFWLGSDFFRSGELKI